MTKKQKAHKALQDMDFQESVDFCRNHKDIIRQALLELTRNRKRNSQ